MDEIDQVRKQMGIVPRPRFVEGPPPREVNLNLIRALHRGQLSAEEEVEIEDLITYFREWHDADKQVLLEFASQFMSQRDKAVDEHKAKPRLTEKNSAAGQKHFKSSKLRTWLAVATAVTILIGVGSVCWTVYGNRNGRMIAYLDDPFGRITKMRNGDVVGLEAFPENYREPIGKMLRTEKVAMPEEKLESMLVMRGTSSSIYMHPVLTIVKSDRPIFQWKPSGDDAIYQVAVYELGETDPAVVSGEIKETQWQPRERLKRGGEYSWEVKVIRKGMPEKPPSTRAMFQVIDAAGVAIVDEQERQAKQSHLVLAVIYLKAALLDDAERELELLKKQQGESVVVDRLIESLKENR